MRCFLCSFFIFINICFLFSVSFRDGAPTYIDNSGPDSPAKAETPREAKKLLNVRKIHLIGKCLHEVCFLKFILN